MVRGRCESTGAALALLVLAFTLIATPPAGADFGAGQRAWDAGHVDDAVSEWRAAANGGDRRAMLALGRLYLQGLGVLQDYVEAHKWLNLAASRGEAAALAERDTLAAQMTQAQIASAQERAAAWRPGGPPAGAIPGAPAVQTGTSTPVPAASSEARRPPPEAIREAQTLLAVLGYQPGAADGIWGRRTGVAYSAFLRDAGLPSAETLTPRALYALRAIAERRGVGQAGHGATFAADTAPAPASPERSATRPASARPDALHRAAQAGDIDLLKAALAAGMDVNARDGQGWTALMHVANEGYPLLVGPLLAAGAGVEVRAPDGATALHRAAQAGNIEVLNVLLAAGADVDTRDGQGWTTLMHAVNKGYPLLVEPLLAAGAGVDVRAPDGATALLMAAAHGHTGIVALLMKAGADISIRGPKGKTPVDVARVRYGEPAVAREKGEDAAVVALLEGRTLAEIAEKKALDAIAEALAAVDHGDHNSRTASVEAARGYVAELAAQTPGTQLVTDLEEKIRRAELTPAMVRIPGGELKIRLGNGDFRRVVANGFWIGKYEVTFDEYDRFITETNRERPDDEGWGRGRRPVINVSWREANAYVQWLSDKLGERYRLPTAAEWEYAARAQGVTEYPWGKKVGKNRANCRGCGSQWDRRQTAPVGSFPSSAWGLHDIVGNVHEWTCSTHSTGFSSRECSADRKWEEDTGAKKDSLVGFLQRKANSRVARGGSWRHNGSRKLISEESTHEQTYSSKTIGFRLARD